MIYKITPWIHKILLNKLSCGLVQYIMSIYGILYLALDTLAAGNNVVVISCTWHLLDFFISSWL